jgi:hypothetical protein
MFGICQLIHSMVEVYQDYPDGFKSLNQNLLFTYSGNSNLEAFDSWLHELLQYFQLAQMTGPSWDWVHIIVTGQVLKDAALRWYINQIKNSYFSQRWTFKDVICELFQHFVHGSSTQKALDAYNRV